VGPLAHCYERGKHGIGVMNMNVWIDKKREIVHTMSGLIASQEVLCCIKSISCIFNGTVPLTVHNMIFHGMELFCLEQWKG
jgi:hypothetical protein